MKAIDASRRAAASTSRRAVEPDSLSLDKKALGALYAALREAGDSPNPPQHLPAARLHGAGGRRSALEGEDPPDYSASFPGEGGNFALAALQALDRASLAAVNIQDGGVVGPSLALAVQDARSAASAASRAAAAAAQAARNNPQDAALARTAAQARANAVLALRYATQAERMRLAAYDAAAHRHLQAARNEANELNDMANAAIDAAAEQLEAAGADPATVAALRALRTQNAAALHASDPAAANALLEQSIQEAEAAGNAEAVAALTAAKSTRGFAVQAAGAAAQAKVWYDEIEQISEEDTADLLAQLGAAEPQNIGFQLNLLTRAQVAANRVQENAESILQAHQDAADLVLDAAAAMEGAGVDAVGDPVADPLTVQEPVGEPGSVEPGGTLMTLDDLAQAGTAAGAATQDAARDALARHGPGNPGAVEDATHASALEQSNLLAAQLLDHPELAAFLRSGGEALNGLGRAAIIYTLGQAIYTDVKNGDRHAPATRKALAELLGGLAGAELGALGGSAGGAALGGLIGSVIPGLGNAVGAFVGGIVGGLGGSIAGWIGGSAAADQAFALSKGPIDHLLDHLIGETRPPVKAAQRPVEQIPQAPEQAPDAPENLALAERIIGLARQAAQASGRGEDLPAEFFLIIGFQDAGYDLSGIDDGDMSWLVDTYGSPGGGIEPQGLARAIGDGAVRIDGEGKVSIDRGAGPA